MNTVHTELLEIAYFDDGPTDGEPVLLLHGWPDDAHGMLPVARRLNAFGYRTIVPFLRGFGPTRFRHKTTVRDGRPVALAQDAIDLLDALHVETCLLIGHDWGAGAAYSLAAIVPERFTALATLGLKYTPNGRFEIPSLDSARMWWYQWSMLSQAGADTVRRDPIAFARTLWQEWSPPGWFQTDDFEQTAQSFRNPDWLAITLHAYRSRWIEVPVDDRYARLQRKIESTERPDVPFLTILGDKDGSNAVNETADTNEYFRRGHPLNVFEGVGHFPAREAPDKTAQLIHDYFFGHLHEPKSTW